MDKVSGRYMMNGIRLFVDDIRKAPVGWHRARTVTEAIRILATMDVSECSLDHDISHEMQIKGYYRPYPCGETFEPVAWYLSLMYACRRDFGIKVTIHSANPAGAEKMASIMGNVGMPVIVELVKPRDRFEEAEAGEGG